MALDRGGKGAGRFDLGRNSIDILNFGRKTGHKTRPSSGATSLTEMIDTKLSVPSHWSSVCKTDGSQSERTN